MGAPNATKAVLWPWNKASKCDGDTDTAGDILLVGQLPGAVQTEEWNVIPVSVVLLCLCSGEKG